MLITSLENEKIKNYLKLKERKYRKKTKTFLVEGMHLVLEAYKTDSIIELILEQDEVLPLDVPFVYTTNEILHKLSSVETPSKVMALCRMKEDTKIAGDRLLLLDEIQDPGNLGTIIRSALAFNVDTVVLSPGTCDLYNPKVIRATQGMIFHLNVVVEELPKVIAMLHEKSIPVYGSRIEYGEDARLLKSRDKQKYAIVMGNEGNGVAPDILDCCDKFLCIPTSSRVESLNVAVATSILLYEMNH